MKVKKVAALVVALAVTAFAFCIPVSAETSLVYSLEGKTLNWSCTSSNLSVTSGSVTIGSPNPAGNVFPWGTSDSKRVVYRISLEHPIQLDPSSDYTFSWIFGFSNVSATIQSSNFSLVLDGNTILPVSLSYNSSGTNRVSDISLTSSQLATISSFDGLYVDITFTSAVTSWVSYWFAASFTLNRVTQADIIGDAIDDQTDAFIEGDGTPLAPDYGNDLNNKSDELTELEDGALGGKTDEEIQAEVDEALDFDMDSLDNNASVAMSGLFDGLLVVFGADYQSLLLLALSLGLAAFIIGRRYKT